MLSPIPPLSLPSPLPFSPFQAKATVKRDGKWSNIDAAEVVPGDLVLLACGSAIPADSRINEGQIEVDQAALTGESLPVTMYKVRYAWDL
jgi:P-type E1-E2 ATPase